uniref:Uncharacterized protein n=1 Tax=Rhizobium loti TaxID=381 RepID=Q8KGV2_RHILI|nr:HYPOTHETICAL PROTEIN [Mesorhizobium japonicum R7A]
MMVPTREPKSAGPNRTASSVDRSGMATRSMRLCLAASIGRIARLISYMKLGAEHAPRLLIRPEIEDRSAIS